MVLVDERDHGTTPRVLFSIEHALQDAGVTRAGDRRVVSKRVLYVDLDNNGVTRHLHYAPYLDYRLECAWIDRELEQAAQAYAVADVVPEHLALHPHAMSRTAQSISGVDPRENEGRRS